MNKKTIIQIVVIVGAFGASAVVLYNGLFKNASQVPLNGTPTAASQDKILPFGDSFNYQFIAELKAKNFIFGAVNYPKVDPTTDIGKDRLDQLISPQSPQNSGLPPTPQRPIR